jgi:hypothetical protein
VRPVRVDLIRPDDLLNLSIEAVNMRVDSSDPTNAVLAVEDAEQPARLIVTFPPQTIAESAYFEWSDIDPELPQGEPDPDAGKTSNDTEDLPPPGTPGNERARVARLARPSRLVFEVPADARLPFTVEGLLDWSKLDLGLSPLAAIPPSPKPEQIAGAPAIREPKGLETALELPYRLWISPNQDAGWRHRERPFTSRGRTELWHTRLVVRTDDGIQELSRQHRAPLRAIWSPDYRPASPPGTDAIDPDLGLTAMAPNDRHQLVILTSAFHGYEVDSPFFVGLGGLSSAAGGFVRGFRLLARPFVPEPFYAEQLMLSPLGGWLRSRGAWTPPAEIPRRLRPWGDLVDLFKIERLTPRPGPSSPIVPASGATTALTRFAEAREPYRLDLSEWVHVASQGRDHYVRIVYEGVLLPFGNRAALVKVTERKFVERNGSVGAYLLQRMFIVVREPERVFTGARGLPFKRVRLTTLVTPNIAQPAKLASSVRSFWVEVMAGGERTRFSFHAVGTDVGDNDVDFTIPMLFMSVGETGSTRPLVRDHYNDSTTAQLLADREARVPGQKVIFARAQDDQPPPDLNAQLVAQTLNFVVDRSSGAPSLLQAGVQIPQVRELVGTEAATTIRLLRDYVQTSLEATNGVFAEVARYDATAAKTAPTDPFAGVVHHTLGVDFSADKAGGFATPDLGVKTLSSKLGPLAATPAEAVADAFNPAGFFDSLSAVLFGTFRLADILIGSGLEQNAPKLRTRTEGTMLVTSLEWKPEVTGKDLVIAAFQPRDETELEVTGEIRKSLNGGGPAETTFHFEGKLNDFEVEVLKAVTVHFVAFGFTARSGEKPDVTVRLRDDPVTFEGDLEFVNELRRAIPPGMFGDGPSLDVTPAGVRAGFAVALPPLAVGVFALKDVSLGSALTLPFVDGKPALDFNFSSREHPFSLAVMFFGGGGFFHLQIDTAGIKQLEAALEFGATASLNLGVASGSVHMMAGIYFSLQRRDPGNELAATLGGYLRVGGSLSVLGLITISVEFNLTFLYVADKEKAYGRATLTVKVEIAFFSKSVQLTVERAFGGTSGDPKFLDQFVSKETWNDYAEAFA